MSRMTIRTYRITPTGDRLDLAPPAEVEEQYRPTASPLTWPPCACPRCPLPPPVPLPGVWPATPPVGGPPQ